MRWGLTYWLSLGYAPEYGSEAYKTDVSPVWSHVDTENSRRAVMRKVQVGPMGYSKT